jgi:hypothetical protein
MLNKAPNVWNLLDLTSYCVNGNVSTEHKGKWYPARPLGFYSMGTRIRAAWMVFTGKADAVIWPVGQ